MARKLHKWFLGWIGQANSPEKELVMMGIFQTWLVRKVSRHGKRTEEPNTIAEKAHHLLEGYHICKEAHIVPPTRQGEH